MTRYKHLYKIGILCLLLGVLFLVSSCSAPKLPVYPDRQLDHYQHVLTRNGLQIIVDPMFDSQENKTYFGTDLSQEDILPIFIMVKNLSAKESYVIFSDKISLNISNRMNANENFEGADHSAGTALAQVFLLPGLSLVSGAAEVKRNFKSKEFQTQTLSAGEQCSGFVYFRLSEKIGEMVSPFIRIEIMSIQDKRNQTFQIPITWKGEIR